MTSGGTWRASLRAIRADRQTGASGLEIQAAHSLSRLYANLGDLSATNQAAWTTRLRELALCRPPIAPLFQLANRAAHALSSECTARGLLPDLPAQCTDEQRDRTAAIAAHVAPILRSARSCITISASSVVERCLVDARRAGASLTVTCLESRPGNEGTALAHRLAQAGLGARLAIDAAGARLVRECDLVLVGADTLAPAGLVHKVGTLGLALGAHAAGVPVFVLAGSEKALPGLVRGWELDAGPPSEILGEAARSKLQAWNGYFDLTPTDLLRGVVDEHGIATPSEVSSRLAGTKVHEWIADLLELPHARPAEA
ncbi:MAG: hypothetical protein IT307_04250 [Chloroflexi bacterium]|nr:hypothetical protein [Chloroflexota bacterium]